MINIDSIKADSDFEQLFKAHYKLLYNAANKILDDRDASEDVVQDVFLKLWSKKDELTIIQSFKSYLYKATINTSLNYLQRKKNIIRLQDATEQSETVLMEDNIHLKQLETKITDTINSLPPKCKIIFVLSRYEGMKYQQIADHLDISIKTVENQMGKALQILREKLKPFLTKEFITIVATVGIATLMGLLSLFLVAMIFQ